MVNRLLFVFLAVIIMGVLTAACSAGRPQVGEPVQIPIEVIQNPTSSNPLPTSTLPLPPTASPTTTPHPTATPSPTSSPTPTATASPTPTLHPMSIFSQRQTLYPGSEIVIEDTLTPGANYSRYYASYQSEGLKIYGLLTVPHGDMPPSGWPSIVFNHGYIPPTQYRTTERYIAYVDWLARSGYIVFRIDYRGHDRSEGAPTGAYGHPGYTTDVLNSVAALKQFPHADPERIGMWGHSMGGFLTLRAMVISPDVKAGVIWGGVVASYPDLLTRWRRGSGPTPTPPAAGGRSWRFEWTERYGPPDENSEFWGSVSANTFVSELSGPIQLHHGTADESVPWEFSELLYGEALQAGKPVELFTYPGDNHNLSNSFSLAMTRTIQFFDKNLKQSTYSSP
jgi:uncharacterized protein